MNPLTLPAGNPSDWTGATGNNTYLLTGRVPALVDAGVGKDEHVAAIAGALEGRALALVLVTHGHIDHVSGIPALRARWPELAVRQLLAGPDPIQPGERIAAGDDELIAVPTPGHSPDHCCFFSSSTGDLFCGDLVRAGGTVVIPASRGGDLQQYLDSLERVRELRPGRLLPGHGPVIEDPQETIEGYLRHRADRDSQILSALGEGRSSPEVIVEHVYGTLPPALRPAAADTVLAHLVRLERQGHARRVAGGWSQVG